MRKVILETRMDEMTGDLGLAAVAMRGEELNSATSGELIAHDLLEHVNGLENIGPIPDELEALGAIWYIRGQWGELSRTRYSIYTPHENLAADIVRMFRDHFYNPEEWRVPAPPRTKACDHDDDLREVIKIAENDILNEIDDEDRNEARPKAPEYLRACLGYMRIGYRKAARKYGHAMDANNLFWAVSNAVEPYLQDNMEGQRYVLRFGLVGPHKVAQAFCEPTYNDPDYM